MMALSVAVEVLDMLSPGPVLDLSNVPDPKKMYQVLITFASTLSISTDDSFV